MVGQSRDVVKARDIAVVSLMDAEEPQEVPGRRVRGSAPFAFPEGCVEVVALADDSAFAGIKCLGKRLKMDEAASELEVGVGDCPGGI